MVCIMASCTLNARSAIPDLMGIDRCKGAPMPSCSIGNRSGSPTYAQAALQCHAALHYCGGEVFVIRRRSRCPSPLLSTLSSELAC